MRHNWANEENHVTVSTDAEKTYDKCQQITVSCPNDLVISQMISFLNLLILKSTFLFTI